MGTNVVPIAAGNVVPIRTREGASALRLIGCSAVWRIDDAGAIDGWLTPAIREALPLAIHEAAAWLVPATRGDFKRLVATAVTLVAPAGWSEGDATAWLAAAGEALRGMPADLLEAGCIYARRAADHPSRIVPAILHVAKRPWDDRKADSARLARIDDVASGRRERRPWEANSTPAPRRDDRLDPADVDEANRLMKRMGLRQRYRPDGSAYQLGPDDPDPCPSPVEGVGSTDTLGA